jgi:fumarate reductase flavoprotein subunit
LRNDLLWPYPTLDTLAGAALLVGRDGRRFLDEGMGGVALANAIAKLDDPLSAVTVFDDELWRTAGRFDFTPPNPCLVSNGGTLISAQTIEELEERLGVPGGALGETIAAYNSAMLSGDGSTLTPARGSGDTLGRLRDTTSPTAARPLLNPPFHAIRLCAGITYTMGGIAIDANARALDQQGRPIPGLYAAGSCAGGAEGGARAGYIGGLCKALSLGYIAARTISSERARELNT